MPAASSTLRRAVDATMEATVVPSFSRIGYLVRRRVDAWKPHEQLDGRGLRVVVTGASSGLGLATARALASAGADVVAVVRSDEKGRHTLAELDGLGSGTASYELADLTDLSQVRELASRLRHGGKLDVLVHNAGAMFPERGLTVDGLERTYQLHVVAPFLLTHLLLADPDTAPSRVLTVTSGGMYSESLDADLVDSPESYSPASAYARAKRAQVALTAAWARRVGARGIDVQVMHPGWADTPGVATSMPGFHRVMGPILRSPAEGADTLVWLALGGHDHTRWADHAGRLWHDRRPRSVHRVPWTRSSAKESRRLWDRVAADAGLTA